MTINKSQNKNELLLTLEGRLDTSTAPELEAALKNSLADITDLKLDVAKLEYISSAGLRVLLSAQKTMNKQGTMTILHPSDAVMEVFDVTGFSDIFTIE